VGGRFPSDRLGSELESIARSAVVILRNCSGFGHRIDPMTSSLDATRHIHLSEMPYLPQTGGSCYALGSPAIPASRVWKRCWGILYNGEVANGVRATGCRVPVTHRVRSIDALRRRASRNLTTA